MEGQNLHPEAAHPLAGVLDDAAAHDHLERVRQVIAKCVDFMPDHAAYIAQHCAA
jgi:tryptophan halogenase